MPGKERLIAWHGLSLLTFVSIPIGGAESSLA